MDINSLFPSSFLKAADLQGQPRRVVIESCAPEQIDANEPPKPVLRFKGVDRGLVLNRTNAAVLAAGLGTETTGWTGHEIELFSMPVSYQGRMVDGIRVRVISNAAPPTTGNVFASAHTFQQPPTATSPPEPAPPPAAPVTVPPEKPVNW